MSGKEYISAPLRVPDQFHDLKQFLLFNDTYIQITYDGTIYHGLVQWKGDSGLTRHRIVASGTSYRNMIILMYERIEHYGMSLND